MEERVAQILQSLRRSVDGMGIGDVLEVLIIAYLVYHILLWVQTTKAWTLLKGVVVILVLWFFANVLNPRNNELFSFSSITHCSNSFSN